MSSIPSKDMAAKLASTASKLSSAKGADAPSCKASSTPSIEGVELALHDGASAPLADDSFDAVEASFAAMSFEGIELMRRELFEIRNLLSAEPQLAY